MPRLDPALRAVLTDLDRGLRTLRIPFAVVGALVPELLMDARPARLTNDADVTVIVESLADFEALKDQLADFGFARVVAPHQMRHHLGRRLDLLPFSRSLAPDGQLELQDGVVMNTAGLGHAVPSAVETTIDEGLTLPLIPLPLYALLKLVAFSDRKAAKDLAGVFHCTQHYLEDDDRRYGAEHDGLGVPFEYTGAYLLGAEGQQFLDADLSRTVGGVLGRFTDPDAEVVGYVARERGRTAVDDLDRLEIFEHFRWYRRGVGL